MGKIWKSVLSSILSFLFKEAVEIPSLVFMLACWLALLCICSYVSKTQRGGYNGRFSDGSYLISLALGFHSVDMEKY